MLPRKNERTVYYENVFLLISYHPPFDFDQLYIKSTLRFKMATIAPMSANSGNNAFKVSGRKLPIGYVDTDNPL